MIFLGAKILPPSSLLNILLQNCFARKSLIITQIFQRQQNKLKFLIYSTCKCSPSQKYCSPGFDFDEKLSVIFNKAISLACTSIDKIAVQSPQGCVNFQLVPRLFPKDGRFGPYFKISTGGDIATVAPYATLCPCLHMENLFAIFGFGKGIG